MPNGTGQFRERDMARIARLRLLDDIFMRAVLKDNKPGVQLIIRILLNRDDIEVEEVRVQDDWPNLVGHGVRLDVTARDTAGKGRCAMHRWRRKRGFTRSQKEG